VNRRWSDDRPQHAATAARRGFTLLEASVVLIVLAIMLAVAIPALQPHETERLRSAADLLAADLRLAQSLAIRDATNFTLTLTTKGWKIEHTGTGAAPLMPTPLLGGVGTGYEIDAAVLLGRPLQSGARLETTNAAVTSVTFTPTGRTATSENTVFWLTLGTGDALRSVSLVVSAPTGLVTAGMLVRGAPPSG
jgi:type II secretion system protein H